MLISIVLVLIYIDQSELSLVIVTIFILKDCLISHSTIVILNKIFYKSDHLDSFVFIFILFLIY